MRAQASAVVRIHRTLSALQPRPHASIHGDARPVVGVIDMENKDGTVYTPSAQEEQLETKELSDTADVVYTGAVSIEAVDRVLLPRLSAVMLRRCQFGEAQLQRLPHVKHVVRMGAGYDNVDLAACTARGVLVSNCPDAWVEEVADNTMSLLLNLVRHTSRLARFVASGAGWTRQARLGELGIRRIRGMRLGIVGLGRIGSAVAHRARPFGFELCFYDPYLPPGAEKGFGGMERFGSFEQMLRSVDAVTFHCPLTEETKHMLRKDVLERARGGGSGDRPGLYVVNAARGGVVEEASVLEGCTSGIIAGAALDSLESEPRVPRELLDAAAAADDGDAGRPNLVLTPHASFYSDEAFLEMRSLAAREVRRVLRGEQPWYKVN